MVKKKINWIDQCKGFGILLVILGHISTPLTGLIYSFHMPFFFIFSGFFLNNHQNTTLTINKNFNKIFIPFFIFFFISLIIEFAKRALLSRDFYNFFDVFNAIVWMDYPNLSFSYGFVLWFLPTLFIGKIISHLLLKLKFVFIIPFLFILFLVGLNVNLPFSIDEGFIATNFIILGHFIYKHLNNNLLLIFSLLSVLLIIYVGIPSLDLANKSFSNYAFNLIWPISLTFLIMKIFSNKKLINLKVFNFLKFFGVNSLLIFLIHPYFNNISNLFSNYFGLTLIAEIGLSIALVTAAVYFFRRLINTTYV